MKPFFTTTLATFLCACIAMSAHAATPRAPALDAWLQSVYGKSASAEGEWDGPFHDMPQRRAEYSVCADSGLRKDGLRLVAVCGALADAGHPETGSTDFYVLRGAAGALHTLGEVRGVAGNGHGSPGTVKLLHLGPAAPGFRLSTGYTSNGVSVFQDTVYVFDGKTLAQAVEIPSGYSEGGFCRNGDRACVRASTETSCELVVDKTKQAAPGRYALRIDVQGRHAGRMVKTSVPVAYRNGRYIDPTPQLTKLGCSEGE